MSRDWFYGKGRFEESVLGQCLLQASARRQAELEVMLRQGAADQEEQRQAKRAEKSRRNAQRKRDKALARERRWKEGQNA